MRYWYAEDELWPDIVGFQPAETMGPTTGRPRPSCSDGPVDLDPKLVESYLEVRVRFLEAREAILDAIMDQEEGQR